MRIAWYKKSIKKEEENEKEIERLNKIIEVLEEQLLLICEMYYDDKETEEMEKWIKELKGSDKE